MRKVWMKMFFPVEKNELVLHQGKHYTIYDVWLNYVILRRTNVWWHFTKLKFKEFVQHTLKELKWT